MAGRTGELTFYNEMYRIHIDFLYFSIFHFIKI